MENSLVSLIEELKRRNVLRVTIAYMVVTTWLAGLVSACDGEGRSVDPDVKEVKAERLAQTFMRLNEVATSGDRTAYQNLFLTEGVMFLPD